VFRISLYKESLFLNDIRENFSKR